MQEKRKRFQFVQARYDRDDSKARAYARRYWENRGYIWIDNLTETGEDKKEIDGFVYTRNNQLIAKVEVEMANNWVDGPNYHSPKYDAVSIPYRKKWLWEQYKDKEYLILWQVFSLDGSYTIKVEASRILKLETRFYKNKYDDVGELFYQYPLGIIERKGKIEKV